MLNRRKTNCWEIPHILTTILSKPNTTFSSSSSLIYFLSSSNPENSRSIEYFFNACSLSLNLLEYRYREGVL
ncbi:hypothetical protein GIB67_010322 [Kingdonia uniflora]|uniref:Uncharacterized protein n=1 Tax=Kingdonia uniflora TaxID=39325 RepID=A0A7J7LD69_9MAGN|nr:hypothetical protein GIB67_010322 [Kingdonia uniflora]